MQTKQGDAIVDFYMAIATNKNIHPDTRMHARDKLRAFALRPVGTTVQDIDGEAKQ